MTSPEIACSTCHIPMRPVDTGHWALEVAGKYDKSKDLHEQKILAAWRCDVWACPNCGIEILTGFGQEPIKMEPTAEDIEQYIKDGYHVFGMP